MSDNFNINTTQNESLLSGGLDPNDPSMTLGQKMAMNQLQQQQQEQLVQQAIERSKQAKIGTQEASTELDTGGYLSEKGQVTKEQALTELKTMLAQDEDMDEDQKSQIIADAQDNWPDVMNAYDLRGYISALREGRKPAPIHGGAFQASASDKDKKDESGDPLVPGQWYQADSEGNYVRSAQPAAEITAGMKGGQASNNDLRAFGKEIDGMLKTRFGATGMLATTIIRADRAINTLTAQAVLTKQDLDNVSTDIAAVYQGGVPSEAQIAGNAYGTTLTSLMDTLRHYTGVLSGLGMNHQVLSDTKAKLLHVLTDMRNSALAQLKQIFEGLVSHYPTLSPTDPAVMKVIDDAIAGISSGLMNANSGILPPTGAPPVVGAPQSGTVPPPPAASTNNVRTSPGGHQYTVE